MRRMTRSLKRGVTRTDGMVFFGYNVNREVWYEKGTFEKVMIEYKKKQREHTKNNIEEFNKKPHPPMFSYSPNTGLYYVGRCGAKERWVTEEKMLQVRKVNNLASKNYVKNCKSIERVSYKVGDVNPEDEGLYFIKYVGNKPMWRDLEGFKRYQDDKKEWERKCQCKRRIRRKNAIKSIKNKIKKGTCKDDLYFWDYNSYGLEVWVNSEEYRRRCERDALKCRNYRKRRAESKKNDKG